MAALEDMLRQSLLLDGGAACLNIDPDEARRFYLPLAKIIIDLPPARFRRIVMIGGLPGSGKTAFTLTLATAINVLAGETIAIAIGMDGWHFSNSYLKSHSIEKDGRQVLLRSIKGMPETFDVASIADFIFRARRWEQNLIYPVYSRLAHDPVSGGKLPTNIQVVLLEGNYLLLAEEPWGSLGKYSDISIFVTGKIEALLPGLVERHLRGGKSKTLIDQWLQDVDIPNMRRVRDGSLAADITIHKFDSRRIEKVEVGNLKMR